MTFKLHNLMTRTQNFNFLYSDHFTKFFTNIKPCFVLMGKLISVVKVT